MAIRGANEVLYVQKSLVIEEELAKRAVVVAAAHPAFGTLKAVYNAAIRIGLVHLTKEALAAARRDQLVAAAAEEGRDAASQG